MQIFLGLSMGIGLSAACGFRVFVPLLFVGIAARTGHLMLAPGFEWIQTYPALITFSTATVLEIAGYYIPWVDNMLDSIAAPSAIVAGAIAMASVVTGMSPFLKWTLSIIAGGGMAGTMQISTTLVRTASSTITAGLGNFVVSTIEAAGSVLLSLLAIFAPLLACIIIIAILIFLIRKTSKRSFKKAPA
jgi:hypothetical protein